MTAEPRMGAILDQSLKKINALANHTYMDETLQNQKVLNTFIHHNRVNKFKMGPANINDFDYVPDFEDDTSADLKRPKDERKKMEEL